LAGWFGPNEKGDKIKINTGDLTLDGERRLAVGRGGEVNMDEFSNDRAIIWVVGRAYKQVVVLDNFEG
jgi:hypothetical protein